jgi:hypothetical protein
MPRLFFMLSRWSARHFCLALLLLMTPAFAETITVPFGWATGQVRNYQVSSRVERSGGLQDGSCTLAGQLRVEVLKREGKSATLRFQLTTLKLDEACKTPSLHQALWLRLSDTPLDAILEPETGGVTLPTLSAIREKIFVALEESPVWFGKAIPSDTRREISQGFRHFSFADAATVAQATGFINDFSGVIGEVYETKKVVTLPTMVLNPFGETPLPATLLQEAKFDPKVRGEFSLSQQVRPDAKEYRAALKKGAKDIGGSKVSASEIDSLVDKLNLTAGAVTKQRVEQKTGWIIESEFVMTSQFVNGTTVVSVRMLYQPLKQ